MSVRLSVRLSVIILLLRVKSVATKRLQLDFQYLIRIYLSTRAKLSNGEAVSGIQ